jgi:hypothetical protein
MQPSYVGQKLTKQKCHCGELHETKIAIQTQKHGLCWKLESPCKTKLMDNMENAFNKMNLDNFFKGVKLD